MKGGSGMISQLSPSERGNEKGVCGLGFESVHTHILLYVCG